jgi:L-rhamnonate dehydratase
MNRRAFLNLAPWAAGSLVASGIDADARIGTPAYAQAPFSDEKSKLRITGVRLVQTKPSRPVPAYTPAPGSWSTNKVEVANPMSIYPEYKATRSLFQPDPGKVPSATVEISTNNGIKGYGSGGPGAGYVIEQHLTKLLMNEDPFNVERLWDIMWRSTMSYGRMGLVINAISAVDLALWDIIGKALNMPVYKLLGGETKPRLPAYCTGNDIEQHVEFGYKRLKLAIPYGPADGIEGMRKNVELVQRARKALGPDGDIMLDCWMAWTERYTIEIAEMMEPYRVYWMEECLQPHDYEGFGRLAAQITSTRIVTGEHEYTRYGFRQLLEHGLRTIWQPDIHWCGGLTELRRIAALAAAYDIPVIPHGGGSRDGVHFIIATPNSPWAELFMPPPGGPREVYDRYEEDNMITRGPEGIYVRPSDRPGFGWDFVVS